MSIALVSPPPVEPIFNQARELGTIVAFIVCLAKVAFLLASITVVPPTLKFPALTLTPDLP